jgi:CDGSH-type Zn-finger protein
MKQHMKYECAVCVCGEGPLKDWCDATQGLTSSIANQSNSAERSKQIIGKLMKGGMEL